MRLRRGWLPPAALPLACVCGALLMAVAAGASAAAWALSDFGDAPAEPPALRSAAARAAVCRCRAFLRWTPARLRFSGVPRATREWFSAGGATEEACRAALEKEDGDGAKRAAIFHVNSANAGQLVANHLCALGWTYVDKEQLAEARAERGEASWLQRGKERGLGWRAERILEWRVNPSLVDYDAMIAGGSDSANMLPDGYLTRKDGLAETLNAWGDSMGPQCAQAVNTRLVPQTFLLADAGECSAFVKQVEEEPGTWYILKPSKGYGGNGLAVWPSQGALDATTARFLGRGNACPADKPSVAQRYLREPLLLDGRKWDLRMYAVLARVDPPVAYYARGHARLSLEAYNESKSDLGVHLTNTNVAKKSADYNPESAEEHNWSIDRLKAHLRSLGSAHAAFADSLEPQIKRMMVTTLAAGHARWADGSAAADNVFQVFGFDFMVTTDLRVWLIEVNKNPLYWPTTRTKLPTTPALVRDTLDVVTTLQTARLAGLTAGCHELAGRRNGTLQPIIDGDWNYGLIQGCV